MKAVAVIPRQANSIRYLAISSSVGTQSNADPTDTVATTDRTRNPNPATVVRTRCPPLALNKPQTYSKPPTKRRGDGLFTG
jgi:hypothetical protein